jgi:hypothetical protein
MIIRLAVRSLVTRPMRSAVLSIGFGLSIAVMAELLGVGEVILEQAHSPALAGGGDVVLSGGIGPLEGARYVLTSVLGSPAFASRGFAVAPRHVVSAVRERERPGDRARRDPEPRAGGW